MRRLEAYGFKSFADQLEIEFNQGITAIVGPNGSGKSNITDAIKWVLGEQNVRNLRGQKTEDIIFAGSSSRRPLGVAEVSLAFDNSDGRLALDFNEVVVTRRIFRSGESEYYINKTRCRLKDIYELFADTGLGKDGISVISQNKVDAVLNSKPEERRLLFEEVAGITKYRDRKKEALRKLESTQQNILRVSDLLSELEQRLGPLAEQAEKTQRHNALQARYRACKITLLCNAYEQYQFHLTQSGKQQEKFQTSLRDCEVQLNLLEVGKERLAGELLEVEKSLQLFEAKRREIGAAMEQNTQQILLAEERLRQNGAEQKRLGEEQSAAKAELESRAERVRLLGAACAQQGEEEASLSGSLARRQADEAALAERIAASSAEIESLRAQRAQQAQRRQETKDALLLLQRDLTESASMAETLQAAEREADVSLAESEKRLIAYAQRRDALRERSGAALKRRDALKGALRRLAEDRETLDARLQKEKRALDAAEQQLKILSGLQKEYEGFGRGVKRVLKSSMPWSGGVCGAVAELIRVEPQYVTAVEIALGANLQNVVTEDDAAARQAIAFLKQEKLGRVTFLPLNTVKNRRPRPRDAAVERCEGFVGYASELVACEVKYREILDFLLGRTVVVDTVEHALRLARAKEFNLRIVTLEGELLQAGGSITGGSLMRREASFLNRAQELERLGAGVAQARRTAEEYAGALSALDAKIDASRREYEENASFVQALELEAAQLGIHLEKQQSAAQEGKAALERCRERLSAAAQAALEQRGAYEAAQARLVALLAEDEQLAQAEAKAQRQQAALAEEKERLAGLLTENKIALTVAQQQRLQKQTEYEYLCKEQAQLENRLAQLGQALAAARQAREQLEGQLARCRAENERLEELRRIGAKDYDNFGKVKMDKLAGMQNCDREIKELRRAAAQVQGELHQIEVLRTKYEAEAAHCLEEMAAQYGVTLEEAGALRSDENNAELQKTARELEAELQALGAVNPNAIEEYREQSERYDFMKRQADDLIAGKEDLTNLIEEMDATMAKQFTAAFAEVNRHFGEIFVKLFGGGQARLALDDSKEVLSSGIEIYVQPPDKKMQNLSVLSGGERALTVIALLFSFLRYKPAPFSVIDEIDAPLDEGNVNRFGAFLQEYARQTQFIVVTHRKGTMQAADVLYGVTVEDTGVSRVLSVKLE